LSIISTKVPAVGSVFDNAAVDYICCMPAVYCVGDKFLLLIMLLIVPAVDHVADSASVDYVGNNSSC
jgi:hypothetical protein